MEIIKLSDHILNENTCTVSWNETHQVHEKNIQSHAMRFIENWGPLVSLPGFHCSMIRFCWTHNVHLGLFQRSNASCLLLGWNWTNETAPPHGMPWECGVDVSIVVGQQGLYVSFVRRVSLKYLVTPSVGIYFVCLLVCWLACFSTFQTNQPFWTVHANHYWECISQVCVFY
jgi:hypothetical protein